MKSDESPAEYFNRLDSLAYHWQAPVEDIRTHFYRGLSESIQEAIGMPDVTWDLQTLVTKCTFAHRLNILKAIFSRARARLESNLTSMFNGLDTDALLASFNDPSSFKQDSRSSKRPVCGGMNYRGKKPKRKPLGRGS